MLATVSLILVTTALVVSQYFDGYTNSGLPNYITKALQQKNEYRPSPKQKKKTFKNITLKEVFDKIKLITRALNENARKNGYKVDYEFRITNNMIAKGMKAVYKKINITNNHNWKKLVSQNVKWYK